MEKIPKALAIAFFILLISSLLFFFVVPQYPKELLLLLQRHAATLQKLSQSHFLIASLSYIFIYILITSFSLPFATLLTVFSGLLFPQPYATFYVVIGASLGASVVFFFAQSFFKLFSLPINQKQGQSIKKALEANAFYTVLFLRLMPIFPFWLVNLLPGLFSISFPTFFIATFLGISPASFAYVQAGIGIKSVLLTANSLPSLLTLEIQLALGALAVFALFPLVLKNIYKWKV